MTPRGIFVKLLKVRALDGGSVPCEEVRDCADGRELLWSMSGGLKDPGIGRNRSFAPRISLGSIHRPSRYVFWDEA